VLGTVTALVNDGHGQLINDSFVTPKYLDQIIDEIADLVTDKGLVMLTDLTDKYWLPLTYLRELITSKKASLPEGCTL
jgi:hypothetical protein